jgi:AcrR family transcriptional regulator
MAIKERKERERQEMRGKILEAAREMFLEEGYDKTSIRNIAEKIEYSPGTIYQYFEDKDEIFFIIHQEGFDKLFEMMAVVNEISNPVEKLKTLGQIYMQFAIENPELYDLMFIMRAPMNRLLEKKKDWERGFTSFEFLESIVNECIEKKLIRFNESKIAAVAIWAYVHGLISLYIRDRFKMLNEEEIEKIMNTCVISLMEMVEVDCAC